jgi:hypothetical protein
MAVRKVGGQNAEFLYTTKESQASSVGIETGYRLGGPGFDS